MKFSSHLLASMAVGTLLSASTVVQAHHSDSAVDKTKIVTVNGTIKVFSWTAPHAQIIVYTVDDKGEQVEVGISTFTPAALLLQGASPKDFRRGDKVEVSYHPNRSGALGGILVKLVGRDGKVLNVEAGPSVAPPGTPPG